MMRNLSLSRSARRLAGAVLLFLTATPAACASANKSAGGGQPRTTIIFSNESLDQATVYVIGAGTEFRRIGVVFAGRTETLTVPPDLAIRGSVNIVARLLANPRLPTTGPVTILPGEVYRVTLPLDGRLLSFLPGS